MTLFMSTTPLSPFLPPSFFFLRLQQHFLQMQMQRQRKMRPATTAIAIVTVGETTTNNNLVLPVLQYTYVYMYIMELIYVVAFNTSIHFAFL